MVSGETADASASLSHCLVICESVAAISKHLRYTTTVAINLSGHSSKPPALCGATIAWDTTLPIGMATCRDCIDELGRLQLRRETGKEHK